MKRKLSFKKIIPILVILVSLIILLICSFTLFNYLKDYKDTKKQSNDIQKITNIEENDNNSQIIESEVDEDNPYWDFIKMNLLDVDLTELSKTNSDTIGWIQIMNTNINYPFVQTIDNDYYLNHSFYKNKNSAGWIFLDYRNNINELDKNTIIYGHGRWDKTMFGTLKNILTNGWLKNKNNYIVRLSTKSYNTMWQVFSVYKIPTTNDYLQINFTDNEFNDFTNMLINRSDFNFNTPVNTSDKILTLSTCYNESEKVVMHAKLIKIASK